MNGKLWSSVLFKSGASGDPVNYRPVSLTCVTAKVMEGSVAKQLKNHLLHKQLPCSEYGLLPGR